MSKVVVWIGGSECEDDFYYENYDEKVWEKFY